MCEQDIARRRARDLDRYHRRTAERKAKGLCLTCGKRPPAPHRTRARDHLLVTGVKPASEFIDDLEKP